MNNKSKDIPPSPTPLIIGAVVFFLFCIVAFSSILQTPSDLVWVAAVGVLVALVVWPSILKCEDEGVLWLWFYALILIGFLLILFVG